MNYKRIYDTIIQIGKNRQTFGLYNHIKHKYENHHIIPKCVGGNDAKENMVRLTCKEHFICHLLLTKIYTEPKQKKSLYAAYLYMAGIALQKGLGEKRNSRQYEAYRKTVSEMLSGSGNPQYGKPTSIKQKLAVSVANKGKIISEETRIKMGNASRGRKHTQNTINLIKENKKELWQSLSIEEKQIKITQLDRTGIPQTAYQKQKVMKALQKQWIVTEPNGISYKITNLRQFCIEKGLDQGNMVRVAQKKPGYKQHKGWKCELLDNLTENLL